MEAPAGCGKTFAGAEWALAAQSRAQGGRVLVLTHTHAASGAFRKRVGPAESQIEVRTLDSLMHEVASAYHLSLDLPPDVGSWARANQSYDEVARLTAELLSSVTMIGEALATRYPIVICDEHQDASADQEVLVMTLLRAGAEVRVMGDPMQAIYSSGAVSSGAERWASLRADAREVVDMSTPHRWVGGSEALGEWTIQAREALASGQQIDVRRPPAGLTLIRADYHAPRHGSIILEREDANPVWKYLDASGDGLLVLNPHNRAVESIRAYFKRRLVIWEGHTRDVLEHLVVAIQSASGNAECLCEAFLEFARTTCTGITKTDCERIHREVQERCAKTPRGKRPPALQRIAAELMTEHSHVGVAGALHVLRSDPSLGDVKIDYPTEYRDAIRLGEFADPAEGLGELHRRRSHSGGALPRKAVSTIHKAKGLEFPRVMLLPVDKTYFPDTEKSRRLLYVGLSRAVESLVMVVPRSSPSELLWL